MGMLIAAAASKSHDVAERVKAWQTGFDHVIDRLSEPQQAESNFMLEELELVANSMRLIGEGYEHRIKDFDDSKSKHSLIDAFLQAEIEGQRIELGQSPPAALQ